METIIIDESDEIPYWEAMVAKSKYFSYTSDIEKKVILQAHHLASKPAIALDIGCEGGRWSKLLSEMGWNMICTEINQASLNICQKRIPTAICILVNPDDSKLPCETESISLALCIGVPPVISSEWFIDEAFRVLEQRGLLVGVFWNRLSWRGLIHQAIATLKNTFDWFYVSRYPQWRRKVRQSGFTLLHEEGYFWSPFRRASNSRLIPIATRIERYLGLHKLVSLSPLIVFIARKD